jgi:hypothetical protein
LRRHEGDSATEDDGDNGDGATDDDVNEDGDGDGATDDKGDGDGGTDNNDDNDVGDDDGDDSDGAAADDDDVDDDNLPSRVGKRNDGCDKTKNKEEETVADSVVICTTILQITGRGG